MLRELLKAGLLLLMAWGMWLVYDDYRIETSADHIEEAMSQNYENKVADFQFLRHHMNQLNWRQPLGFSDFTDTSFIIYKTWGRWEINNLEEEIMLEAEDLLKASTQLLPDGQLKITISDSIYYTNWSTLMVNRNTPLYGQVLAYLDWSEVDLNILFEAIVTINGKNIERTTAENFKIGYKGSSICQYEYVLLVADHLAPADYIALDSTVFIGLYTSPLLCAPCPYKNMD